MDFLGGPKTGLDDALDDARWLIHRQGLIAPHNRAHLHSPLNRELLSVLLVTTVYSLLACYAFDKEMHRLLPGCDHVQNRSVSLFKFPKSDHIKKRWINFV